MLAIDQALWKYFIRSIRQWSNTGGGQKQAIMARKTRTLRIFLSYGFELQYVSLRLVYTLMTKKSFVDDIHGGK